MLFICKQIDCFSVVETCDCLGGRFRQNLIDYRSREHRDVLLWLCGNIQNAKYEIPATNILSTCKVGMVVTVLLKLLTFARQSLRLSFFYCLQLCIKDNQINNWKQVLINFVLYKNGKSTSDNSYSCLPVQMCDSLSAIFTMSHLKSPYSLFHPPMIPVLSCLVTWQPRALENSPWE